MVICDIAIKSKKFQEQKNINKFIENIVLKIIALTDLKKFLSKKYQLEINFSLVSDLQMKKINYNFRQKNKATNVLSFSYLDELKIQEIGFNNFLKKHLEMQKFLVLGDIVLAYETIKKEAILENKKFNDHLTHLIVHGILHLIGYDHEQEKMAKIMEELEIKILKKLQIENPYKIRK
jgi:probable rRNA maturation factor